MKLNADRLGDLLVVAGQRYVAACAAVDAAAADAADYAHMAINAGLSERLIASKLGVNRNTLRAWLGKPRRRS
jgi:transposase-like protein